MKYKIISIPILLAIGAIIVAAYFYNQNKKPDFIGEPAVHYNQKVG